MKAISLIRIGLWAVVALLAGATLALYLLNGSNSPVGGDGPYGSPFRLVDQDGAPISEADLRGKPTAVFFGFTHCPEVCPTTLAELAGYQSTLKGEGRNLQVVFVSVDPERDTPAVLKDYVGALGAEIRAVTGNPDSVAAMLKGWGVYAEKVPQGDSYTMDHTASVFLLDAEGRLAGTIAYGESSKTAMDKLERLTS